MQHSMDVTTQRKRVLLVEEQMRWFGSKLRHSLPNPNWIRGEGQSVFGQPIRQEQLRIDCSNAENAFILFIYWALLCILIRSLPSKYDPSDIVHFVSSLTREEMEKRMISSSMFGMTKEKISATKSHEQSSKASQLSDVEYELSRLSPV